MVEIIKRNKALSVSPLKSSQPVGASLAFLGMNKAMPMLHGSQGCTAFGKVFFVRHFREPIPLQTTAMEQISTIMGADENVIEGLKTLYDKSKPELVGVITTGLSDTQGTDIKRLIKEFRQLHPQCSDMRVVPVNAPDFIGCLETGFATAILAMIDELVPMISLKSIDTCTTTQQVNVLVGSFLTPSDVEYLKEVISSFGLQPIVLPDLSDSLDGHTTEIEFTPLTVGGTSVQKLNQLYTAKATLVIGHSVYKAADLLKSHIKVPDFRFDSLLGLAAFDQFLIILQEISGNPVPAKFTRQRAQLQDAMLDTHFMLGQARIAIAVDPDELYSFSRLLVDMGSEVVAAVTAIKTPVLQQVPTTQIKIGDLEDLEKMAKVEKAQLLIGNSHAVDSAKRLGIPILRASFPQYDYVGGYQRLWIGYQGTRQLLFDLANLLLSHHANHEIKPYHSIYAQKTLSTV